MGKGNSQPSQQQSYQPQAPASPGGKGSAGGGGGYSGYQQPFQQYQQPFQQYQQPFQQYQQPFQQFQQPFQQFQQPFQQYQQPFQQYQEPFQQFQQQSGLAAIHAQSPSSVGGLFGGLQDFNTSPATPPPSSVGGLFGGLTRSDGEVKDFNTLPATPPPEMVAAETPSESDKPVYIGGSPGFYDRFPEARGELGSSSGLTMDRVPIVNPYLDQLFRQQRENQMLSQQQQAQRGFEQRYIPPLRTPAQPFIPRSAKDYRSPFQQIVAPEPERRSGIGGKGRRRASPQPTRGEQIYFDRPVKTYTAPAAAPMESVAAPTPDPYYDYSPGLYASGGTIKAAAGRYLQGPGDGTSDSIPATIGNVQPARLADGEFVIDARTVSEIGNGSSNAGAKKLYAMMERVHRERKKAKRGQNSNADRFLPR